MNKVAFLLIAAATTSALADRTLNRESAKQQFAPIEVVQKVERLEAEALTRDALKQQTVYVAGETMSVTTRQFAMTTLRASSHREEDTDTTAELIPADSRNYDVFLPDDEKTRTLLPISLKVEVDGAETYVSTNRIEALPAFVRVREPSPGIIGIGVVPVR